MFDREEEDSYNRRRLTVFRLKALKKIDLARLYNIPKKTLENWLRRAKIYVNCTRSHYLSIEQVRQFIAVNGMPEFVIIENLTEDELQTRYSTNAAQEITEYNQAKKRADTGDDEDWGQDSFDRHTRRKK
jgi:hypothetical protein